MHSATPLMNPGRCRRRNRGRHLADSNPAEAMVETCAESSSTFSEAIPLQQRPNTPSSGMAWSVALTAPWKSRSGPSDHRRHREGHLR